MDSLVENAAHDLDHWRMFVVVAGEEHPAGFARVSKHGLSVLCVGRQGLLAQHVQPVVERSVGDFGVVDRRGCDIDEIQPSASAARSEAWFG